MTFISYAQNFEDVMLWRALSHVGTGFYIDVGAAHPDDYSVTRAFYDRGWRGINVEPTSRFTRLAGARPRDVNLHMAVGRSEGRLTLFVVEDAKDISTLDPMIAQRHRNAGWTISESPVPVATLAEICREHVGPEHGGAEIHFLKIDVEGAERDVLLGADFTRFRPWIVVVEATAPNSQVTTHDTWDGLLVAADYRFAWFDGLNRFYIAGERWSELSPSFAVPPNVFDDFLRAADTEHLSRIIGAEARTAMVEARLADTDARAAEAEARASQAEASAAEAACRAAEADAAAAQSQSLVREAEALAREAELRMVEAAGRAAEAEADAGRAIARAREAEARAAAAEESRAEVAARHRAALVDLAALHASTSWRLTAPLRVLSRLLGRR